MRLVEEEERAEGVEGEERAEGVEGEGIDHHQYFGSSDSEGKLVEVPTWEWT